METPGAHLRAALKRLGIDQAALSTRLGVSRQTINNIINGRQEVSRSIARKLAPITGHARDYWLRETFEPAPPIAKEGVSKRQAPASISFAHFVQKERGEVASALKASQELASLSSWSDLRRHVKRLDDGDAKLVEARALWRRYVAAVKDAVQ